MTSTEDRKHTTSSKKRKVKTWWLQPSFIVTSSVIVIGALALCAAERRRTLRLTQELNVLSNNINELKNDISIAVQRENREAAAVKEASDLLFKKQYGVFPNEYVVG